MNCEYRNGLCCYDKSSASSSDDENSSSEDDDEGDDDTIHPVDNLLTLLRRSDNILRQNIMAKLSLCQVATPLLLPNYSDDTVTLLLWAMRSIVKKWCIVSPKKVEQYIESPIVDYCSPVVSFLRIGSLRLRVSKSEILNHVIDEFKFFFFEGCNGVNCKKKFTDGLVDLCCYLPGSSTDKIPLSDDLVLFLNLHGNALKSKKQVNFIQKLSAMSFVFIKESEINEKAIQMIKNLAENAKTIVVVEKTSNQKIEYFDSNVIILKVNKTTKTHSLKQKCQKYITETVKTSKKIKLSGCSEMANSCEIIVDEDDEDCKKGFKEANEILNQLETCNPMETKLKFFPLQGPEGWKRWSEIDKKQYQEIGKQRYGLEKFNTEKETQKLEIRKNMEQNCTNLTLPVGTFLKVLLQSSNNTTKCYKHYFLIWLKLLLDKYNRSVFVKLSSSDECPAMETMIGLEHFFREMGQFYETVEYLKKGSEKHSNYPHIMAELMADGYCMEIMDGNSTHVPIEWVSAVFKELQIIYKHSKLYTVSIVGIQSTGKSTLLNTTFGVNFDASAGRCTCRAFVQLLSFHKDAKDISKCDHLLLIDTEGLRAPELQSVSKQHDNELATFVVGLSDVAIINIGGESQGELSDILQTVSYGLIRMKSIEINPSCKFVHHQIAAPGAKIKTTDGRKKFLQVLDEYVQQVCEFECCDYKSFTDFMKCDEDKDILYFNTLWYGNLPMAKVNKKYVEDAQNLKMSLIEGAGQHKSHYSFENLNLKINTIWNAVLREQFLFSFKNILEVIVRKEYDQKHCEWNAEFRLDFLKWEYQAKVSFHKHKNQDAKQGREKLLNAVQEILEQRRSKVLEKRDDYFKNSKHKEILAEWEAKSNDKIDNYYEEYVESAKQSITQLFIKDNCESEVKKMMKTIYKKLDIFALDLFTSNPDVRLSDRTLEEKFNEK